MLQILVFCNNIMWYKNIYFNIWFTMYYIPNVVKFDTIEDVSK